MKVSELIEILNKQPLDKEVIIMDHRMNIHFADGEGTHQGIYEKFEIGIAELMKKDYNGDYDENTLHEVTTIYIENDVDYEKNGDRIEY